MFIEFFVCANVLVQGRWIAQLIVASGSVVARAFTQALRNEMQGEYRVCINGTCIVQ